MEKMVIYFSKKNKKWYFPYLCLKKVSVLFSGTPQKNDSSGWVSVLPLSVKNTKEMCYKDNKTYNHLKIINTCRIQETSVKLVSH